MGPRSGVLLTSHGTVSDLEELPQFLARIRAGRPVPDALVQETRRRYALIGGSPLLRITEEQAAGLERRLGQPVLVGMRLAEPGLEAALVRAEELAITRLTVLPLAPFSVHVYMAAAEAARARRAAEGATPPQLVPVAPWGSHPLLVRAHAEAIRPSLKPDARLILTAHSLPLVALRNGDPYERLVREAAEAIGRELRVPFELAFQSQGADGGEWLGPSLRSALEATRAAGVTRVVLAPFGFLSEHVETLYDLDIEARGWCNELGLELIRVSALGASSGLIDALAAVVKDAKA